MTPRLNRLAEMAPVIGATSFDTMTAALPSAEQALLMEMSAPPSFGLTEDIGVMLEKVHQAVIHYAAAETSQHNQILGHTVFSWTGDADTAWASQSSPRQVKMHRRTVRMALVSRDTTIRLLFLTVQSAIKIAALSSGGVTGRGRVASGLELHQAGVGRVGSIGSQPTRSALARRTGGKQK